MPGDFAVPAAMPRAGSTAIEFALLAPVFVCF